MRTLRAPQLQSPPVREGLLALALLVFVAAGCGPPPWPVREPVSSAHALIKSVRERRGALKTLYSPGSGMRYGWRPARADIYLGTEDRFRVDITHPLSTDTLFTLVVSDGRFICVDRRKKKGSEGDIAELISARYPKLDLGPDVLVAWQLFLPTLEERSGESVALAEAGGAYVLEFWQPDHVPTRQVWVDASSHVPTRDLFYRRDGRLAVEFRWRRLTWWEDRKLVLPHEVEITVPSRKARTKLVLVEPQLDKDIKAATFSLARERRLLRKRGGKIEEIKPEPKKADSESDGDEAATE